MGMSATVSLMKEMETKFVELVSGKYILLSNKEEDAGINSNSHQSPT